VFRFLRREGRDEDAAREPRRDFLRACSGCWRWRCGPAAWTFRYYLLGAVNIFSGPAASRSNGSNAAAVSQRIRSIRARYSPGLQVADHASARTTPVFDREWALASWTRALQTLAAEFASADKSDQSQR